MSNNIAGMSHNELPPPFATLPIGVYRLTLEGHLLTINKAFAQLHGYKNTNEFHQLLGNTRLNPYAEPERIQQVHSALLEEGTVYNHPVQWVRHRTGETIWVRESAHLVRDSDQLPLFYEGTAEDVTQETLSHQAMLSEHNALQSLLQAIPDQLWLKDLYGTYRICNQHFADAMGLGTGEIIGSVDADHPHAPLAAHYFVADESVVHMARPIRYEVETRTSKSNDYATYEIIKAPVRSAAGGVSGVLALARNITERKLVGSQLMETEEQRELALLETDIGRWDYYPLRQRGLFFDASGWHILDHPKPAARGAAQSSRGQKLAEVVHPDDLPSALQAIRFLLEDHSPNAHICLELRLQNYFSDWKWTRCRGKVIKRRSDGTALCIAGSLTDIHAFKTAAASVTQLETHLQAMQQAIPCIALGVTHDGIIRSILAPGSNPLGLHPRNVLNRHVSDIFSPIAATVWHNALEQATSEGSARGRQFSIDMNGRMRWFELSVVRASMSVEATPLLIAFAQDITDSKARSDTMNHLAFHDALTGLPNRRLLMDRLERALARSARNGLCGAVLFIDLDHFKALNDTHGHVAGDALLKAVGTRLQNSVRDADTVARLGGDEFVILLSDLSEQMDTAQAQAQVLASKILLKLRIPHDVPSQHLPSEAFCITPSIGITLFGGGNDEPEALLARADAAMYQAKADGGNCQHLHGSQPTL